MTGAGLLAAARMASDPFEVSADGRLLVAGEDAAALLARFGSPLQVISAATLEANLARIRAAFAACWPAPARVLYAIKANNTLAIRALLSRLGAGGDCFGMGELRATLDCGTDPALVVMNGSNKEPPELAEAARAGVAINIDSVEEIAHLRALCAGGARVRANLRLKVLPADLDPHVDQARPTPGGFTEGVRRVKWGFTPARAAEILRELRAIQGLDLAGFSCHVGHLSAKPEAFAAIARALGAAVAELRAATGLTPRVLDIGGGWPPERDPSFRRPGLSGSTLEEIVRATCAALRGALPAGMPTPELWIEPGRFIVSNAVTLLGRIGAVKRDADLCWAHCDISTNNLPRIETGLFHYAILPAERMHAAFDETVQIVGSTCFRSVLGADRAWPAPRGGEAIAIPDAGAYAEVFATQFNAVPRPAAVMVSAHGVELVRERESIEDIFRHHRIPHWIHA